MTARTIRWAPLGLLLLAGVAHGRAGALPLEVEVLLEGGPAVPEVPTTGVLSVTNRSGEPVALLLVGARCGADQIFDEQLVKRLPATAARAGAALSGRLLVEQIGAEARLPAPPRWEWAGEDEVATFPVLEPGGRLQWKLALRPTEASRFVEVEVRYAFLGQQRLLGLRDGRREAVKAEGNEGRWVEVERLSGLFAPGGRLGKSPQFPIVWSPAPAPHGEEPPLAYPFGLLREGFERLEENRLQTRRGLALRAPVVSLEEARARARVLEGPFAYALFAGTEAWVLEKKGDSVLVGASKVEVLPGRLVEIVGALNRQEAVEVELFASAAEADPGELVGFLRARRFRAESILEKGGTWRGTLRIRRAELRAVCAALGEKGARIEGMRVVRR